MGDSRQTVLLALAVQGAGTLLFGGVLLHFRVVYRQPYLTGWARSSVYGALYAFGGVLLLALPSQLPPTDPLRLATGGATLLAGYLQAYWLALGARGLAAEREAGGRPSLIVPGLVLLAVAAVLPSPGLEHSPLPDASRALLLGVAAFNATLVLQRLRNRARTGFLVLAGACLLLTAQQLAYLVLVAGSSSAEPSHLSRAAWLVSAELLIEWAIGVGVLVCLLEAERARGAQATARIEHLAFHDSATGLPNRRGLSEELTEALEARRTRPEKLAVMFLDLDGFKLINDSLGYVSGDELLSSVGRRLQGAVGPGGTVARVGSDEFALLFRAVGGVGGVGRTARSVLDSLKLPFMVDGRSLYLSGSLGVSVFPDDGQDAATLIARADSAMYSAKRHGNDSISLSGAGAAENARESLSLQSELRRAFARDELVLYYQPQVDPATGVLHGLEALVRWEHPERGLLGPGAFVGVAEVSGLIGELGAWVLHAACDQAKAWKTRTGRELTVAVNLSARQFRDPHLVAQVAAALGRTGLDPGALELEITETAAMEDVDRALHTLGELHGLGVRLAIDDFGTGHSSLSYLRRFPIHTLKIDRSFVSDLEADADNAVIVSTLVTLAHSLGLKVVGEGVETEAQWRFLRAQGCDLVQGFLFSRPLPTDRVPELLAAGTLALPVSPAAPARKRAARARRAR